MQYANPPVHPPANVFHRTFDSPLAGHEIGYNIYLPPDYTSSGRRYPVFYHLHGWTGSESSEIEPMARICQSRDAITEALHVSLPAYMIPNIFMAVDEMPMTKNGKIDRNALLDMYKNKKRGARNG